MSTSKYRGVNRSSANNLGLVLSNDEIDFQFNQGKVLEAAMRGDRRSKDILRRAGLSWWRKGVGVIVSAGEFHPAQRLAREG